MSQIESPNFTQIPNVVFDYWMPRLKPSEFTILLCLCRKIFGWHKTSDFISATQLVKATGLTKNTVLKSLDSLVEIGLVLRAHHSNEEGNHSNEYALNVEKPEDETYQSTPIRSKFGGGSAKNAPGVGQNLTQGVVQKLHPQKKDLTKERLNKEHVGVQFLTFGEEKNVRLTQDQYDKLLKKMKPSEREYWIETVDLEIGKQGEKKFNAKYKSHYHVILSWKRMREEKGEPIGKIKDTVESNKELAYHTKENFAVMCQQRHCRIDVGPTYIEIIPNSGQMQPTVINFTEKGFKDQLNNALRKWRLL